MNQSTLLFVFLALIVGGVLFKVKYAVVEIEQKLAQTQDKIQRERENIHILRAEWSHLNEPQRLQKLAEKYLDLQPMKTEQVAATINDFGTEGYLKEVVPRSHLASIKGVE
jgi:cell division protein FtsL